MCTRGVNRKHNGNANAENYGDTDFMCNMNGN